MGKIVINKTDAGQKILLDSNEEGVTGGYYDRQEVWHEFGGGGSAEILPALTITFKNRVGQSVYAPGEFNVTDGLLTKNGEESLVETGDDYTYTAIVPNSVENGAYLFVGPKVVTDMINCTIFDYDGDRYIKITNVSEVASCTITDE